MRGPKEIGAPTGGIGVAAGATALTPRDKDLTPVLGPGVQRTTVSLFYFLGAAGRGGRSFLGALCPLVSLVPGGCDDRIGDARPGVFPLERLPFGCALPRLRPARFGQPKS